MECSPIPAGMLISLLGTINIEKTVDVTVFAKVLEWIEKTVQIQELKGAEVQERQGEKVSVTCFWKRLDGMEKTVQTMELRKVVGAER